MRGGSDNNGSDKAHARAHTRLLRRGGVGVYAPLAKWEGAGATVPLTGFGFAMVKGVKEAIAEKGALGILTGPLTASSAGITAAVLCGLIASFVARPKEK